MTATLVASVWLATGWVGFWLLWLAGTLGPLKGKRCRPVRVNDIVASLLWASFGPFIWAGVVGVYLLIALSFWENKGWGEKIIIPCRDE